MANNFVVEPEVGSDINPYTGKKFTTYDLSGMGVATTKDFWNFYEAGNIQGGKYTGEAGVTGTGGWGNNQPQPYNQPQGPIAPTWEPTKPKMPSAPNISDAPAYEPSPEEQAWAENYQGELQDWLDAGGYGIPEETQELMQEQIGDVLKADEEEQLRVMKNDMERRGITNSGLLFSETQKVKANTTQNLAKSITDVKIQSELMKLASFEKAMGAAGQFLDYLSTQSQLKYQPEFATWQVEQEAKLIEYQQKMDVYKLNLAQAHQEQNMEAEYYYNNLLQESRIEAEKEMMQMEIEANEKASFWGGLGNIFGFLFGWLLL
jgi:hypothetical protein